MRGGGEEGGRGGRIVDAKNKTMKLQVSGAWKGSVDVDIDATVFTLRTAVAANAGVELGGVKLLAGGR